MKARKIAVVAPYMKPLTELVVDYIREEGFEVVDWRALEIPDNLDVARHDPENLPAIVQTLDLTDVDVIVLSACVQMPSLPVIAKVEAMTGKPVLTAAVATTYCMLKKLGLEAVVPGAERTSVGRILKRGRSCRARKAIIRASGATASASASALPSSSSIS